MVSATTFPAFAVIKSSPMFAHTLRPSSPTAPVITEPFILNMAPLKVRAFGSVS
jgi:hypothetical protein